MNQGHIQNQLEMSRNVHDVKGLDNLRRAAKSGDENAVKEAAKQFEAIFVQMMLKSMRKAQDALADKDSPFNSQQVKFYRDMHDQQLAVDLSTNGNMGLADLIVQQLSPDAQGFTPASVMRGDATLSDIRRSRAAALDREQTSPLQSNQPTKQAVFASPKEFIETLLPRAEAIAEKLGISPKALLAQAAVETGWGKYVIHDHNGKNSHNLFGIKADKSWQGDKTAIDTLEYQQGIAKQQKAAFRTYSSFEDSLQDYVSFVKDNPRYEAAINNSDDPKAYFNALQKAGYATDPAYADKVMSVFNGNVLNPQPNGKSL